MDVIQKKLYDFTLNVLNEGKPKNLAPWYYTASFLADKLCDTVQALEYIRQAKSLPAGQDLRDAICVFDIYLQAKSVEKYDAVLKITSTMIELAGSKTCHESGFRYKRMDN